MRKSAAPIPTLTPTIAISIGAAFCVVLVAGDAVKDAVKACLCSAIKTISS